MSHNSLARTGLQSIYYGPTCKENNLDRLYGINIDPKLFNPNTYVSHIKTHHLGVIALPLNIAPSHNNITRSIHAYRRRHPNQHKACLDYLSSSSFNLTYDDITESVPSFDTTVNSIFKKFYPHKQITIKSSDPPFINPFVKSLLRQKNCLMRKGKIRQATSITNQIRIIIITSNKLSLANSKRGSKAMWSTVNKLRGKFLLQMLTPTLMPIHSIAILLLYLTHPTILNSHISYQHHTILIISHLLLYIIFLIKVALKEQDLMVSQAGFSNLFLLQSVSLCRPSTTTDSNRHFFH